MTTEAQGLSYVRREEEPILPPPARGSGALAWLRESLFSSPLNVVLTLLSLAFVAWALPPIIRWAFVDAVWTAPDREACAAPGAGACWAFVDAKFSQFMYGRYPIAERWRVDLTGLLLVVGVAAMAIPRLPGKRVTAIYLLGVFPLIALVLLTGGDFAVPAGAFAVVIAVGCFLTGLLALAGAEHPAAVAAGRAAVGASVAGLLGLAAAMSGLQPLAVLGPVIAVLAGVALLGGIVAVLDARSRIRKALALWLVVGCIVLVLGILSFDFGLAPVGTHLWGGLLVTLVVAIVGMVASMPLGVVLALGRRSTLPVIRFVSIVFIEFVRGVPLITVLFMASFMIPLFLPPGVNFDKLLRALIGVALFSAAYMAEVVRGGLQAIPSGQYEAADALGLGYWSKMRLVVLPQALKIVIPGIVNSFISLFKDTSLVFIIGIFDLLGAVSQNFTDARWMSPNTPATGYVFAAVVFWVFCFGMSRYSIFMERRLQTGYRR